MRVPAEVLSHIFFFCTVEMCPGSQSNSKPCTCSGSFCAGHPWLKVTHVCCFWRQAALDDHKLWSTINANKSSQWTNEMIMRSGSRPVTFSAQSWSTTSDLAVADVIAKHGLRFCSLNLELNQQSSVITALKERMISLEALRVYVRDESHSRPRPPPTELSPLLPSGRFVSLWRAVFDQCLVPWTSFRGRFPYLTHLDLTASPINTNPVEFANVLCSMPALLVFRAYFPPHGTQLWNPDGYPRSIVINTLSVVDEPIIFQHLTTLILNPMRCVDYVAMINALQPPSLSYLRLACNMNRRSTAQSHNNEFIQVAQSAKRVLPNVFSPLIRLDINEHKERTGL